jgi:HTH-type transcriptional regulator/antitoxin HigA
MTAFIINAESIASAWNALQGALPIRIGTIHNDSDYENAVAFMNSLLDVVGDGEDHELVDVLDLIGQLVADYEAMSPVIPQASPSDVLRFLMEQN